MDIRLTICVKVMTLKGSRGYKIVFGPYNPEECVTCWVQHPIEQSHPPMIFRIEWSDGIEITRHLKFGLNTIFSLSGGLLLQLSLFAFVFPLFHDLAECHSI